MPPNQIESTEPTLADGKRQWLSQDVMLISLSACFADLGYQTVLAVFPLFLVVTLKLPVWVFALAMAVSFGPGALFGLWGGKIADRIGAKKAALGGNLLIPLLSLSGLTAAAAAAIALFSGGWWARNFRSPPRRSMMVEAVHADDRAKAFGFLHALDIGGGFLAALGTMLLLEGGINIRNIFLLTIIPLLMSSVWLMFSRMGRRPAQQAPTAGAGQATMSGNHSSLYRRLLLATALYGFSSFSFGFPILTVDQSLHSRPMAVLSYVVFFGVSAVTGLVIGRVSRKKSVTALALGGYLIGGLGCAGMALVWATGSNGLLYYPVAALMGLALGVIETLEPAIISRIIPKGRTGGGMGALTAMRSIGLFSANLIMGVIYHMGASWTWAYAYAAILAIMAAGVTLSVRTAETAT